MVSDRPGPLARADAAQRGIFSFRSPVLRSILNPPGFGGVARCWAGLRRGAIAQHLAKITPNSSGVLEGSGFRDRLATPLGYYNILPPSPFTSPTGPDRSLNCVPRNSRAAGSAARRLQTLPRRRVRRCSLSPGRNHERQDTMERTKSS